MIRASIDLGTNTCLLLIVEWNPESQTIHKILTDQTTVVRLGEGVDRFRKFQPVAMERTLVCLKEYTTQLRKYGARPESVVCVATSQARDASNSSQFFEQIKSETDLSFQIISGDQEARYTFQGALLPGMDPKNSVVLDIGGGSTEIISTQGAQSIDIGSVRFTERYLKSDPVTDEEFWACQEAIDEALRAFEPWQSSSQDLIAVAGTATTLAALFLKLNAFDPAQIDEARLTRGDLHRMVEELKWRTVAERQLLSGMEPARADVILAGALILWRVLEKLHYGECRVSTRGLRYGALTSQLGL